MTDKCATEALLESDELAKSYRSRLYCESTAIKCKNLCIPMAL
jgi:hypothetical protein